MKNTYQIPVVEVTQIGCIQTLLDASSAAPMSISNVVGGPITGMSDIPEDPSTGR